MASLGTRINEYRRRRNITQEQLAEAMGVSSQAVSKWENDISCPDISLLPPLSDYFGVSLDVLLRGEGNKPIQILAENQRKDLNQLVLRMIINSSEGDLVKLNLPMPLVKAGLQTGLPLVQMGDNNSLGDAMRQIDFSAIIQWAENGVIGRLLEIKSASGDIVEMFIE